IWVKLNQLSNDSPWSHLAHQKRPPTRTSLAPLARPSSAGVFGEPSDSRPRRFYLCTANIHSCLGRRLTLTALRAQRARPSAADVAHCPSHVRPRRPGLCSAAPATTVLPPAAQDESGGSDSSEKRQRERTALSRAAEIAIRACAQLTKRRNISQNKRQRSKHFGFSTQAENGGNERSKSEPARLLPR
ncbi:hypothetical protein TYRP_019474, partial [Tyrophagus putrescentiae]